MRQRRKRKVNQPSQNLDSFLDILTNTVGVLMFISLFVSLLSVDVERIIKTPLRAETEKEGKFFELRKQQVFYVSNPEIENKINELLNRLPNCELPEIPQQMSQYLYDYYLAQVTKYRNCTNTINRELGNFYFDNGEYVVTFINDGSIKYEPNGQGMGENNEQLQQENSRFIGFLETLDPKTDYIAFIVRPDSFSTFRAAREEAIKRGFQVGWEPFEQNNLLVFGSGGRAVGVQ